MTKTIVTGAATLLLAIMLVYVMITPDMDLFNLKQDWGTKKMYACITDEGAMKPFMNKKGSHDNRYYHYLMAYDVAGEGRPISFTTPKELKKNSLLRVVVKGAKDQNGNHAVGRYDVIGIDKVPPRALEKLDVLD